MKLLLWTAAASLALVALITACKASVEAEAGPGTPIFGGSKVRIEVDGRTVSVPAGEPQPKAGDCVHVNWLGANGEDLGGTDVVVGGPGAQAPPGAEGVTVSPCKPAEHKGATGAHSPQQFVSGALEVFAFRYQPLDFTSGRGRFVDFTVSATDDATARTQALEFLRGTLERSCPPTVTPYGFADVEVLQDGRVRFSIVSLAEPRSLSFSWNSRAVGTLAQARVARSSAGWYASTLIVPAGLVFYGVPGLPVTNSAAFDLVTRDLATSLALSLTVQP